MSEIISNKSNNVQAKNVDVRAHNAKGGALTVTNDLTQTEGDLVKITGLAGKTALNVSAGDIQLQGSLGLNQSSCVQAVAVPAAAAAAAASRILSTATVVTLTPANDANDRAYLPSPTSVVDGKVYIIQSTATGCELSAEGDGTTATTINATEVTNSAGAYAKELALAASSTFIAVKTGANAWTVTPGAAAPDA